VFAPAFLVLFIPYSPNIRHILTYYTTLPSVLFVFNKKYLNFYITINITPQKLGFELEFRCFPAMIKTAQQVKTCFRGHNPEGRIANGGEK
jgi:hypothetical protein